MDRQGITSKRKRSQNACEPCRHRKRKCDGRIPCITCCEWGYNCFYDKQKRGSNRQNPSVAKRVAPLSSPESGSQDAATQEEDEVSTKRKVIDRVEANSGAAFILNMGVNIDSTSTTKLNLFGWNIGQRHLPSSLEGVAPFSLFEITSAKTCKSLATVYFDKVNPCFGLIDPEKFFQRLELRSDLPLVHDHYDSTFAIVSALGSLFSRQKMTPTEALLVQYARSMLESNDSSPPSVQILTGWVLYLLYMRMTAKAYPTWLVSSNVMHMLEASGAHRQSNNQCEDQSLSSEIAPRERLVGVARHLNLWISFDLGLSRVSFSDEKSATLSDQFEEFSDGILSLWPISASLDPGNANDGEDLKSSFLCVLQKACTEAPEILAQCNLLLCMIRRLHIFISNFDPWVIDRILTLLQSGLESARALSNACCPWHHIANVPFHTLYALLVLDTRASFRLVNEAMETVWQVASTYNTVTMRGRLRG